MLFWMKKGRNKAFGMKNKGIFQSKLLNCSLTFRIYRSCSKSYKLKTKRTWRKTRNLQHKWSPIKPLQFKLGMKEFQFKQSQLRHLSMKMIKTLQLIYWAIKKNSWKRYLFRLLKAFKTMILRFTWRKYMKVIRKFQSASDKNYRLNTISQILNANIKNWRAQSLKITSLSWGSK